MKRRRSQTQKRSASAKVRPGRGTGSAAADYRRELMDIGLRAKRASQALAMTSTDIRNRALEAMAKALEENREDILFKNGIDVEAGRKAGLSPALLDRLALTPGRLADMAKGLRDMAALPDPVGEMAEDRGLPNGLRLQKVRVPLGVVAIVFEARPNV